MPLLTETLPIDRYAKCFFGENFDSALSVAQNGGTIVGTPVINRGIGLNGTTDYVTYDSTGWFVEKTLWSCHIDCWPHFEYNDALVHNFFNTTTEKYRLRKYDDGNLQVSVGGTVLTDIDDSVYYTFWKPNRRNVITLSLDSTGDNNAWLNGHHVMVAEATAWVADDVAQMAVGATVGGASFFNGRINMIKYYNSLLTEADHRYYYGQG